MPTEAMQPTSGLAGQPKNFFELQSGKKYFLGPPKGVLGQLLPQKILKIKFLRLAKNAFPGIFKQL